MSNLPNDVFNALVQPNINGPVPGESITLACSLRMTSVPHDPFGVERTKRIVELAKSLGIDVRDIRFSVPLKNLPTAKRQKNLALAESLRKKSSESKLRIPKPPPGNSIF